MNSIASQLKLRYLGIQPYQVVWADMQTFTKSRDETSIDEFWVLQHFPIFTLGQAGKSKHLLSTGDIPVIKTDRGGQVTYHGPGQLIIYLLIDLRRRKLGIRHLVTTIEEAIIETLGLYNIKALARADAPGVYTENAKIASLGLRVKNGCTFHGLSLNIDMNLEPFQRINVCGHQGLAVTQMIDCTHINNFDQVTATLLKILIMKLGYIAQTEQ